MPQSQFEKDPLKLNITKRKEKKKMEINFGNWRAWGQNMKNKVLWFFHRNPTSQIPHTNNTFTVRSAILYLAERRNKYCSLSYPFPQDDISIFSIWCLCHDQINKSRAYVFKYTHIKGMAWR